MELRREKITIRGKEYELQELPARQYIRMQQRHSDKSGKPIVENLYDEMIENIIVSPKGVKLDDFRTAELEELMGAVIAFQQGE